MVYLYFSADVALIICSSVHLYRGGFLLWVFYITVHLCSSFIVPWFFCTVVNLYTTHLFVRLCCASYVLQFIYDVIYLFYGFPF